MQAVNFINGSSTNRTTSWQSGRGWTLDEQVDLLNLSATQSIRTIARKLGRTEKSIRRKLEQLGRTQELLTGFKTKDLAHDLQVSLRQVRRRRVKGYLENVGGRITEESFEKFCRNHPDKIPYRQLSREIQLWLDGFGYPANQGFRLSELAQLLKVSPKTIRRWIGLGWLQIRQKRITEDSLARFCRQHPQQIRLEELPPATRETLRRLKGNAPPARETITLELLAAAGL